MKDKSLKVNKKFYGVKTTLVGASIGATAMLGILTLANTMVCHKVSPFFDSNDMIEGHKIVSHVYSKDGEKVLTDYKTYKDYDRLFGMKYYDNVNKRDDYLFWDASNFSEDKIEYISSYLDKVNKYDLEVIRSFLTNNAQIIRDNALENQYFTSKDGYELKYINIDEDSNDTKMIQCVSEDQALFLNVVSGGVTLIGFGLGAYCGNLQGKQKKKSK